MTEIRRRTSDGKNWHYTTRELLAEAQEQATRDQSRLERLRAENEQLLTRAEAAETELAAIRALDPAVMAQRLQLIEEFHKRTKVA